jgi:hypothetical protein
MRDEQRAGVGLLHEVRYFLCGFCVGSTSEAATLRIGSGVFWGSQQA